MPEIEVIRAAERQVAQGDATTGIVRERAVEDRGIWAGLVRAAPGSPSGWHHHGAYDTVFYVQSGQVRMEWGPDGSEVVEAGPGDFVHVPPQTVHREWNPGDEEGVVILTRVGEGPPVVNVDGPTV